MFKKIAVALIAASILAGPALAQGLGAAKQAPVAASTTVKSVKQIRHVRHVRPHVRYKHMRHVRHVRHVQANSVKQIHVRRSHHVHTATRPASRSTN